MKSWGKEHWILLSMFLAATASVVSGLENWGDFFKPAVLGGFILQLSTVLRAFYSDKPEQK